MDALKFITFKKIIKFWPTFESDNVNNLISKKPIQDGDTVIVFLRRSIFNYLSEGGFGSVFSIVKRNPIVIKIGQCSATEEIICNILIDHPTRYGHLCNVYFTFFEKRTKPILTLNERITGVIHYKKPSDIKKGIIGMKMYTVTLAEYARRHMQFTGTDANKVFIAETFLHFANQLHLILKDIVKIQYNHRDLKPENIMVSMQGKTLIAIDFGLSHAESSPELQKIKGTPYYLLFRDDADEYEADAWSVGQILLYLLNISTPVSSPKRLSHRSIPIVQEEITLRLTRSARIPGSRNSSASASTTATARVDRPILVGNDIATVLRDSTVLHNTICMQDGAKLFEILKQRSADNTYLKYITSRYDPTNLDTLDKNEQFIFATLHKYISQYEDTIYEIRVINKNQQINEIRAARASQASQAPIAGGRDYVKSFGTIGRVPKDLLSGFTKTQITPPLIINKPQTIKPQLPGYLSNRPTSAMSAMPADTDLLTIVTPRPLSPRRTKRRLTNNSTIDGAVQFEEFLDTIPQYDASMLGVQQMFNTLGDIMLHIQDVSTDIINSRMQEKMSTSQKYWVKRYTRHALNQ